MSLAVSRRSVLGFAAAAAASAVVVPYLPAWAAEPAADLVASTAAEVIEIVKKTPPGPQRQAAIQGVLNSKFDLPYMGQFTLGANWNKATEAQRTRFLKAVENAEARAYSERFGQYGGQTLQVGRVISRPNGVYVVDSKLSQSNGQPIKLDWEVRNGAQGLRIVDVKVEGVSMIQTRKADFASYIQNNGGTVEPLIAELEARAKR